MPFIPPVFPEGYQPPEALRRTLDLTIFDPKLPSAVAAVCWARAEILMNLQFRLCDREGYRRTQLDPTMDPDGIYFDDRGGPFTIRSLRTYMLDTMSGDLELTDKEWLAAGISVNQSEAAGMRVIQNRLTELAAAGFVYQRPRLAGNGPIPWAAVFAFERYDDVGEPPWLTYYDDDREGVLDGHLHRFPVAG